MTKRNNDGYLDEIQERMDGDMFKAMLEVMAQRVMEEELERHLGAERHERTEDRRGHRNGYKPRGLKTRVGELALQVSEVSGKFRGQTTGLKSSEFSGRLCPRSTRGLAQRMGNQACAHRESMECRRTISTPISSRGRAEFRWL